MRYEILAQGGKPRLSTAAAIKAHVRHEPFDHVDVAAAYATSQGIRAFLRILGAAPVRSRWIIGLDDAITQPEAIDELKELPGAKVRVARLSPVRRFHPKVYLFRRSSQTDQAMLVVSSGNLTERGLHENAEGTVLLHSESAAEVSEMQAMFQSLWALGHQPSKQELQEYSASYKIAKVQRKVVEDRGNAPNEPAPAATVSHDISGKNTSEAVIALAVTRIAAAQPDSVCSLDLARDLLPKMVPLTALDFQPYKNQNDPRWVQILRNIKSNSNKPGPGSRNFIVNGYLEGVGEGYRITDLGRRMLAEENQ